MSQGNKIFLGLIAFLFLVGFLWNLVVKVGDDFSSRREARVTEERLERERTEFLENIETHYEELINFVEQEKFDKASIKIKLFERFEKTDYFDDRYRKIRTPQLEKIVRPIPASDFDANLEIYRELLELNPDEQRYKDRVNYYSKKKKEAEQKRIAAEARKKRIEEQFSAWDGSHTNLTRYIERTMSDPKSYKHDSTVYWDRGDHLVVKTSFRGKNVFGGVVRNTVRAKVSLDGTVLQVLEWY